VIVVIIALGFGLWFYIFGPGSSWIESGTGNVTTSTNKDETASWKTYTNTNYSVSFKYPKTWLEKKGEPTQGLFSITFYDPARETEMAISSCVNNELVNWANPATD